MKYLLLLLLMSPVFGETIEVREARAAWYTEGGIGFERSWPDYEPVFYVIPKELHFLVPENLPVEVGDYASFLFPEGGIAHGVVKTKVQFIYSWHYIIEVDYIDLK